MNAGSPIATLSFINECNGETAVGTWIDVHQELGFPHGFAHRCYWNLAEARNNSWKQACSTVCLVFAISRQLEAQPFRHLLDRDSTISRNHLTLRCVLFDEDAARWNVSPMVYAEDSSMNGTVLSRDCSTQDGTPVRLNHKLTKSVGPVLLQDGDRLYFSKSTFVQYQETSPDDRNNMSSLMSREVQVGQGSIVCR